MRGKENGDGLEWVRMGEDGRWEKEMGMVSREEEEMLLSCS